VRALALRALAGSANAANAAQRADLAQRIAGKLVPETDGPELAAALVAARNLKLIEVRKEVFALLPKIGQRRLVAPDGTAVDTAYLAGMLGDSWTSASDADPAVTADLLGLLAAGLDDGGSRGVCLAALAGLRGSVSDQPALRDLLDRLVALGIEPNARAALRHIVGTIYGRADIAKACGDDVGRWRATLDKDRPLINRVRAIESYLRVEVRAAVDPDAKERRTVAQLRADREFLRAANAEVAGWVSDPAFVHPIGTQRKQIDDLKTRLNDSLKLIGDALMRAAGSGTGPETAPAR
jgi:hypothetical protein